MSTFTRIPFLPAPASEIQSVVDAAADLAARGLSDVGNPGKLVFAVLMPSFLSSAVTGSLLATLADPFAGLGLGSTTYATFGTVPAQLALDTVNGAVVAGSASAVAGTSYAIGIKATSGDGKRVIGAVLSLAAVSVLPGNATNTGSPDRNVTRTSLVPAGASSIQSVKDATADLQARGYMDTANPGKLAFVVRTPTFAVGQGAGTVAALLSDPFAGMGLGTTTWTTFGAVPGQLSLDTVNGVVMVGSTAGVAGQSYSIGVLATAGDGSQMIGEYLTLGCADMMGPIVATVSVSAAAGSAVAVIVGLKNGDTVASISPNDGRAVIAGGGTALVTGLTASSAGRQRYVLTTASGLKFAITVAATISAVAGDPNRYMFFATGARVPSGAMVAAASGTNYVLTRKRFGSPQYAINHLRLHFSGFACTEGSGPTENVLPGNAINIDGAWVSVNGSTPVAAAFVGAAATSFASGALGAWTDDIALGTDIPAEASVDVYTLYHSAVGENQVPVHLIGANDRVWGASDAATLMALIGTDTPSTAALATYPSNPPMYYGPDMMLAKGWDGRPVPLVVCDSIGERQNDHILAADTRGNLGWLRRWLDRADATYGRTPHFLMGVPGASSDRELITGASDKRWQVLDQAIAFNNGKWPFTCVLDQLGQNNTSAGSTVAAMVGASEGLIDRIKARYPGVPAIGVGQLVHPASSDGFRTLANQVYQTSGEYPNGIRFQYEAVRQAGLEGRYTGFIEVVEASGILGASGTQGKWPEPYFITKLAAPITANDQSVTLVDKPMLGDFLHFNAVAAPTLANVLTISGSAGAWVCGVDRKITTAFPTGQEVYAPNANDGTGTPRTGTHPRARMIPVLANALPQSGKAMLK